MNTPNFTMIELNAAERRQAILHQAQQDQLLATSKRNAGQRSPLRSGGLWVRHVLSALTGAVQKSVTKRAVVRSGSVS